MDLAGTPTIPRQSARPGNRAGREARVRLMSPAEVASAEFIADWNALADEACEPNPFFEPWFVLPSLQSLASGSRVEVFAHYEGGRLTGLVPLARGESYFGYPVPHVAAWLHDNAFSGVPLVAKGSESGFWRALLRHLDDNAGRALFAHLPGLNAEGPMATALDEVLAEGGRPSATVRDASRAMLRSDLSPGAYLEASMSAKKRKELRRQHKRLAEEGALVVERVTDASAIGEWVEEFLALEASGWKGNAGSALGGSTQTRSFFDGTLSGAARAGKLERLSLRLDGRPIAMLASFLCPPGAFAFKTAFDEDYARFSPGLLLQIENLDLLACPGIEWADSCAAQGHSMIERIWREKRRIVCRNIAIGGPLRRAAFRAIAAYETRGKD